MTDIVLANRMGAYGILVRRNWSRTFKACIVGWAEDTAVRLVRRWTKTSELSQDHDKFTQPCPSLPKEIKLDYVGSTWTWSGRALGIGQNTGKRG